MGEIKRLSDAEHEIMNIIWEKGESMCVGDVFEYLSETDWKYTTVATFLTRLEKKGFLKCIKKDGKNYYECIADRDKYRREQTDDLINELYDGERELSANSVLLSTLLCFITIPLLTLLVQ